MTQPQSATQEVLAGYIERVTYHNAENGFCVLRAKARGHRDVVTVVGRAATCKRCTVCDLAWSGSGRP
jgi:exodeoxyribonuclease V alpha subunit